MTHQGVCNKSLFILLQPTKDTS